MVTPSFTSSSAVNIDFYDSKPECKFLDAIASQEESCVSRLVGHQLSLLKLGQKIMKSANCVFL